MLVGGALPVVDPGQLQRPRASSVPGREVDAGSDSVIGRWTGTHTARERWGSWVILLLGIPLTARRSEIGSLSNLSSFDFPMYNLSVASLPPLFFSCTRSVNGTIAENAEDAQ